MHALENLFGDLRNRSMGFSLPNRSQSLYVRSGMPVTTAPATASMPTCSKGSVISPVMDAARDGSTDSRRDVHARCQIRIDLARRKARHPFWGR